MLKGFKWVTNSYDGLSSRMADETQREADQRKRKFEATLYRGAPQATDAHTEAELRAMGVYGLYRWEGEADDLNAMLVKIRAEAAVDA